MENKTVKFSTVNQSDFFKVLRDRVNVHFKENKRSKNANANMWFKTFFMLFLYLAPFSALFIFNITAFWQLMLVWTLMGLGMAGIGLSIMHDANHGSYSKNKQVNSALGFLLNLIGGYHVNWKIQHNVLHHTYTNIDGHDEDISKPIMRFSPDQERKPIFKYQIFYAPFLYGLMTIYWLLSKDFEQAVKYQKRGLLKAQGLTWTQAVLSILFNKLWYIGLFIVLPLVFLPFPWWQIMLGFLTMHIICGLILAFIFQPAHVVGETEFFSTEKSMTMENSFAIHQLLTTSNYAYKGRMFSWFVGGLNFQIEHHLFPNICHVHYRDLSPIVKRTALEFNLPYHHHPTFLGALSSHFKLLNDLGTGKYDLEQVEVA